MTTPVAIIKTDPIWFKNAGILFKLDRITEFFPNRLQTLEERMNSVVRLGVYASILLCVYKRNYASLAIIPVVFLVTWVIYKSYKKESMENEVSTKQGILKQKPKIKPTLNNPFMNVTMDDYTSNPQKEPAGHYYQDTQEASETRQDIKNKFEYNLYRDEDIYEKNNSDRQFYTTPNTQIPSDQESYLNFLYGDMKENCKTNVETCQPYEDIRGNPMIFPNKDENPTVN